MLDSEILILVSDHNLGSGLENAVLKPAGYKVTHINDPKMAIKLLHQMKFDLMIVGENVGDQRGMDLAGEVNDFLPTLPIILLHRTQNTIGDEVNKGVWDFICIPAEPNRILNSVRHTVARSQKMNEMYSRQIWEKVQPLQTRLETLEGLLRVGRSVTSLLDLDGILATVVDAAVDMTGAEEGSLLLLDESTGELYMHAARNFKDEFVRRFRLPIRDSLAGQVMRTGQPLAVNAATPQKIKTSYLVHTLIYVPLNVHNRIIGVLGVDNRQGGHPFQEDHLGLLTALADYAAIAIENARAFSAVDVELTQYKSILENLGDGVIAVDPENRIILANETVCKAFNIYQNSWIGRPVDEVFTHPDLLDIFETGGKNPHQVEIKLDDGRIFICQTTSIPGEGLVVSMQDITHIKELDRIKSDFVNIVSHDLRTPLTAILGYVDLIKRVGQVDENQLEFIRRIQNSVKYITTLINDLLDLGSVEAGFDGRKEIVPLWGIVQETLSNLGDFTQERQQNFIVQLGESEPLVLGSPVRLRQMVANLVSNAIKFTPPGGRILLQSKKENGQVILQIIDSGPGIPITDQPYIFDKFYRASNVPIDASGTGLGLAIVKSIVENHDGRIWVDSNLGQGSTFTVILPVTDQGI